MKRTWFQRKTQPITWLFRSMASEVKAFCKCWHDFRNKDKHAKIIVVIEEHGAKPRWKAEMTFAFEPEEFRKVNDKWFPFPTTEDIRWLSISRPNGYKGVYPTHKTHWGPARHFEHHTIPFAEIDGRVIRFAAGQDLFPPLPKRQGSHRCPHCNC
ncbi:hypothetical protein F5Y16DRAFT_398396 [Xylariaceae sp. FL0255]|nr:hypothetical protein F5Y16DRAFT_398396 [Xylariaceae sp. FL0255]